MDGSHNHVISYARPGSIFLLVLPYNFRVPDWKLLGHLSGLRVLELISLNRNSSITDPKFNIDPRQLENSLKTRMVQCYDLNCRFPLRHTSTIIEPQHYWMFLAYARTQWNKSPEEEPIPQCQIPLQWPMVFRNRERGEKEDQLSGGGNSNSIGGFKTPGIYYELWREYGYALNFQVCEPPSPYCVCCKDKQCTEAASIQRGF